MFSITALILAAPLATASTEVSPEAYDLIMSVQEDSQQYVSVKEESPVTLKIGGFLQTRFTYSRGGGLETNHGFSVPRARLILSGNLYDWEYKVSGQWSDDNKTVMKMQSGSFILKDAYAQGSLLGGTVRVGQFKSPFMREVLVAQQDTLMTDRSIIANTFGQGRSQGVQWSKDLGKLDIAAAYTDGFNTANDTGIQNGQAATARFVYDVWEFGDDRCNVGAAISYNDLAVKAVNSDYLTYTLDTKVSVGALDLTAAYVATSGDAGDNWGSTVQAGYMCMDNLQGFVAYEFGEQEGISENLSTITVGANYFVNDNIKWTTDLGYALNGIDATWNFGETGWRSGDSGEYVVRTQLQISF